MIPKPLKKSERVYSENDVVKKCNKYLKDNFWLPKTMFTGGIPIGGGKYATNPCKGIPDCIAMNMKLHLTIWIEYKKSHGGILSYEQQVWHKLLRLSGQTVFVVNSVASLKEQLSEFLLTKTQKEITNESIPRSD